MTVTMARRTIPIFPVVMSSFDEGLAAKMLSSDAIASLISAVAVSGNGFSILTTSSANRMGNRFYICTIAFLGWDLQKKFRSRIRTLGISESM